MKSKKSVGSSPRSKKLVKPSPVSKGTESNTAKLTLFDHVKHIRGVKDPEYYNKLSEENRKSFNHFMILRALAMDDEIVGEMAFLYKYFHIIPSAQFYTLLIALTPNTHRWVPWIKTKVIKHNQDLLALVAQTYSVSKRQANEYVNVLIASDEGLGRLTELCSAMGLNDKEVENLFDKKEA